MCAGPRPRQATLLASAATSVSFAMLVLAANRGFRHFGIIGGIGMLLCWVFTFALVPALLAVFERIRPVRARRPRRHPADRPPPWLATRLFAHAKRHPPRLRRCSRCWPPRSSSTQLPVAIEHNLENLGNELQGQDELLRDHDRGNGALGKLWRAPSRSSPPREAADAFCAVVRSG